MKVMMLVSMSGADFNYSPGDIVELEDDYAKRLIETGQAEIATEELKKDAVKQAIVKDTVTEIKIKAAINEALKPPPVTPAPAIPATATLGANVFTAMTAGVIGNSIALIFDGVLTVTAVTDAWNLANTSNQVSFTGDGTIVHPVGTTTLSGGVDAVVARSASAPAAPTAPAAPAKKNGVPTPKY